MNQKKISDFLSADEEKLSALILCLFALCAVAGYSYIQSGDITEHIKDLIETLILAVAGMNVADRVSAAVSKNNESKGNDEK